MIKTGKSGNIKRKLDLSAAAPWEATTSYTAGNIVSNGSPVKYYLRKSTGISGAVFDAAEEESWIDVSDGIAISKMGAWKLAIKQKLIEASHFGEDGWDSSVPGSRNWDVTIDGSWDVKEDTYGQKVLQDAVATGEEIELELYVDENATGEVYSGKAYVEEFSVDTSTKDLVKVQAKCKGNGKLAMP